MDESTAQLCERIRQGDKKAFEEVFRTFYPHLCAYATGILENPDLAEEVVQDVFYRIWLQRENLDVQFSLKAYLFKSVRNGCMNHLKHQSVKQTYEHHARLEQMTGPDVAPEYEFLILQDCLNKAVENLPPERKKVFQLVKMEGRRYKEAAEILGVSVKTIENQMGKAMIAIRDALSAYLPAWLLLLAALSLFFSLGIGEQAVLIVSLIVCS